MSFTFAGWETFLDNKKQLKHGQEPKRGHTYTMYHGTHLQYAKVIISQGFKRSQDGLLGAGVYVSRDLNKAMCYPLQTDNKNRVVFKLKVRIGKVKKIDCDNHPLQKTWHQNGYHTAWVPPNSNISTIKSGREEDCVWDPKRIIIVDIAFCMDDQTKASLKQSIKQKKKGEQKHRKGTAGNCQVCGKEKNTSHPTGRCWKCSKVICPFMGKHICKKREKTHK